MTSAAKAGTPWGMALVGCGSAVPVNRVSNEQLSTRVDTSDEWIRTRTGIGARRICNADEPLTVIATRAAEAALEHAGWQPEDLDLILMATSSPDDLFGTAPGFKVPSAPKTRWPLTSPPPAVASSLP